MGRPSAKRTWTWVCLSPASSAGVELPSPNTDVRVAFQPLFQGVGKTFALVACEVGCSGPPNALNMCLKWHELELDGSWAVIWDLCPKLDLLREAGPEWIGNDRCQFQSQSWACLCGNPHCCNAGWGFSGYLCKRRKINDIFWKLPAFIGFSF